MLLAVSPAVVTPRVQSPAMMSQYCVLVADAPEGIALIEKALHGAARIIPARTGDEAISRAVEADIIALGVHFNNSRIFDVIRMTKSDPDTRYTPLLCFRVLDRVIPLKVLEALDLAQSIFGQIEFLDFVTARRLHGETEALRLLRAAILVPLEARIAAS